MYNEQKKRAFIESVAETPSYIAALVSVFNKAQTKEEELKKDISQFTKEEMESFFSTFDVSKSHSIVTHKSTILRYCKWSDGTNELRDDLKDLDIDYSQSIESKYVFNPEELDEFINYVFEDPSNETVSVIYKTILWLLFMGVKWDDIDKIKNEDVDLDNRVIHYDGRDLEIYDQAYDTIKSCKNRDTFYVATNHYVVCKERPRERGDMLIRSCTPGANKKGYQTTIRRHMNRAKTSEELGKILSVSSTYYSGNFYRAMQKFREYEDQEQYLIEVMLGKEFLEPAKFDSKKRGSVYNKRVYLRKDFKAWRKVYLELYGYPKIDTRVQM